MKINIFSPPSNAGQSGNKITSERWTKILTSLGHEVELHHSVRKIDADISICLNALKTSAAVRRIKSEDPSHPVLVVLTGTDIYSEAVGSPEVLNSFRLADSLIAFHELTLNKVPREFHYKSRIIRQSAQIRSSKREKNPSECRAIFLCHIRKEKDPLRLALALRELPEESKITVDHYGGLLDQSYRSELVELSAGEKYHWHGELDHDTVMQHLVDSDVLINCSLLEGAANVLSEAIVNEIPIIATSISGNIGVLGEEFPGFYRPACTEGLKSILMRFENDVAFVEEIRNYLKKMKSGFLLANECEAFRSLLSSIEIR